MNKCWIDSKHFQRFGLPKKTIGYSEFLVIIEIYVSRANWGSFLSFKMAKTAQREEMASKLYLPGQRLIFLSP